MRSMKELLTPRSVYRIIDSAYGPLPFTRFPVPFAVGETVRVTPVAQQISY